MSFDKLPVVVLAWGFEPGEAYGSFGRTCTINLGDPLSAISFQPSAISHQQSDFTKYAPRSKLKADS